METQSNAHNRLDIIQTNLHDEMVNSDGEDDREYESERYSDDDNEDGTNTSNEIIVKRGITRLCKFRITHGKPGVPKLKVTFDALNRISGLNRALFSSFLGDLVREHIGLKILCWKLVKKESRHKTMG